jgi:hypothetical protein
MSTSTKRLGSHLSITWSIGILLIAITCISDVLGRLRYGTAQYAFFSDDFFCYARIARNIAYYGVSTFDGTTITNGYHPLWMLVLVGLWRLGGENHFIALVLWCIVISAFAVYCLVFSISRVLGMPRLASLAISLWAVGAFLVVDSGGMEGVLAVPLAFLSLRYLSSPEFNWSRVQCVMYGLLASLTVLARVDTALLFATLLILQIILIRGSLSAWLGRLEFIMLGGAPLVVYCILNKLLFGQSFPISGTAKTLKLGFTSIQWDSAGPSPQFGCGSFRYHRYFSSRLPSFFVGFFPC